MLHTKFLRNRPTGSWKEDCRVTKGRLIAVNPMEINEVMLIKLRVVYYMCRRLF